MRALMECGGKAQRDTALVFACEQPLVFVTPTLIDADGNRPTGLE